MSRRIWCICLAAFAVVLAGGLVAPGQQRSTAEISAAQQKAMRADFDGARPKLAFRAEWKREPGSQHPVIQTDLIDQNVEVKTYGDGKNILWTQHIDEPTYAFTGMCEANCAVAFRPKGGFVDLSGLARIRIRSKQSGFHILRPIVKLADGTWLAADYGIASTEDWIETDIPLRDLRWRRLQMPRVVEFPDGAWTLKPDLSKVEEIGVTDLSIGPGHGNQAPSSRLAWLKVYGRSVPR